MNKFIQEFSIKQFRGINGLALKNLSAVNLFVGENNGGKTSVLEAICCLRSVDAYNLFQICRERKRDSVSLRDIRYLFYGDTRSFEINASLADGSSCNYASSYSFHPATFSKEVFFQDEEETPLTPLWRDAVDAAGINGKELQVLDLEITRNAERRRLSAFDIDVSLGRVKKSAEDDLKIIYVHPSSHYRPLAKELSSILKSDSYSKLLIELLKLLDSKIERIETIPDELFGSNEVYIKREGEDPKPISVYGDGTKKLLNLAVAAAKAKDGYLLLDEIETSLHYDLIENSLLFLTKISEKFNVQLFITTHSKETIDCFYEAMKGKEDSLRIYTLRKEGEQSFVRGLNGTEAQEYERAGVEVRK